MDRQVTDQEKLVFALTYPEEVDYLDEYIEDYKSYTYTKIRPRSFLKWFRGTEKKEQIGLPFWK